MAEKVTAGRDQLGGFAPVFAEINDDVLFGKVWSREEELSPRDRSIVTVVSLMSQGLTDSSFMFHLQTAKAHGVSSSEIAEIITHVAFYMGWPKAWAAFRMAKDVWADDDGMLAHQASMPFPIGELNDAFAQYFVGRSYLSPVSLNGKRVFNVTFEPGCRNNWHIHHAEMGGGQILICVAGRGCYQERGKEAIHMKPGDAIEIPAGVEHWHGAVPDSWFSHIAIEVPGEGASNEWLEPVEDSEYQAACK